MRAFLVLSLFSLASAEESLTVPLFGEKIKGYVQVENVVSNMYSLSFKMEEVPLDARASLHMAAAPYDSAVMTENCRRAKKSPQIFRDKMLKTIEVDRESLLGHTLVLSSSEEIYACATIILPGHPLLYANFHSTPIQGPVYIIPMTEKVRLLPDLKYVAQFEGTPDVDIIGWSFVEKCDAQNTQQSSGSSELGIDSRATLTIETPNVNASLINFELFRNGKPFACAPIQSVEQRTVRAGDVVLSQPHYYVPVKSLGKDVDELHIRDDCLDLATETIHQKFHQYFPSIAIFGPDTVMLKSAVVNNSCSTLRPQFPLPSATVHFSHPVVGQVVLVDTGDRILLTGNLRHIFDDQSARATVQVSPRWAEPAGCPLYLTECSDCFTVPDAAVIVGKSDPDTSLIGVLPYFSIQEMRSVIVDLQWTDEPFHVCANISHLPEGSRQASAQIKRYSPISDKTMATIVVLEYPANNYSEVVIRRTVPLDGVAAHSRPIDMSITSGPPCGEQTVGPKVQDKPWIKKLKEALKKGTNDTTFTTPSLLISGEENILGTSLLFTNKDEVYCGSFEMPNEKTVIVAKFEDPIEGFIVLTQHGSASLPTEVDYFLNRHNSTELSKEFFAWDIVSGPNMTCEQSITFNPFQANSTQCSNSTKHLCSIGSTTEKSGLLQCGARRHLSVPDLPLTGSFSVAGKEIRLSSSPENTTVTCAQLLEFKEASLRWTVLSNRTLSELQQTLASRLDLAPFQVKIDYNRELLGGRCSTYRIAIIAPNDKLDEVFHKFSVEKQKFEEDEDPKCADEEKGLVTKGLVTEKNQQNSSALCSLFMATIVFVLLSLA